jgi:peptidoglycan hydrolase CwlO-like protein
VRRKNREAKLTSDLETCRQKLGELESELDKRFTQHRSLQKEHEQATRQLDAQRKQAEAANAQLQLRETELHGLRQELEQRHELLRQKDSRLTTIREERDDAQKSVAELENRLATQNNSQNPDADPARLSEQLAQAQERIRELEADKQAQPAPQAKPAPSSAPAASGTTELLACKAFIEAMQERGLIEEDAKFTPTREREAQIGSIAALLAGFLENTAKVILSHVDDLHVRQPRLAELAMPITYFQQEFGERVVWSLLARPQSAYDDPVVDLDTFLIPVRNLNICFLNAFQQVLVKHIKRVAHEELSPTRIGIAAKTRSASRLWAHYESQVAQQAPSAIADQCLEEFVALADRFYRRAG